MYYIFYDNIEGTILGLSIEPQLDIKNNWVTVSEEAYNFILDNNGLYIIDINSIQEKVELYKEELFKYKTKQIKEITYVVVEKENLKLPDRKLSDAKLSRLRKNYSQCNMYIENGITYDFEDGTSKQFTYKLEDQVNLMEMHKLIDDGILSADDIVPFKGKDDTDYDLLPLSTVIDIHNKLIKNKHYNLFYLRQINAYTETLNSFTDIDRMSYGMILPEDYRNIIEEQMTPYENL